MGSASHGPAVFRHGISQARQVFDKASSYGLKPHILDIEGGFWSRLDESGIRPIFEAGDAVNAALAEFFPAAAWPDIQVIAEPGRYFAESCATQFALVHTVKQHLDGTWQYYLTDGTQHEHASACIGNGFTRHFPEFIVYFVQHSSAPHHRPDTPVACMRL